MALAKPMMPGTLRVPERIPFSCPPPPICSVTLTRGFLLRTYNAPIPFGPYNLCALIDIRWMSMSAHKLYGPKGIGALYVRSKNPRVKVTEQIGGGGHENGMRSGTLNVPAIIGFAKAIEIAAQNMSDESARVASLRDTLERQLLAMEGTGRNGHPAQRLYNTINITFPNVPADDLMMALKKDVAISSGSACSSADAAAGKISHVPVSYT